MRRILITQGPETVAEVVVGRGLTSEAGRHLPRRPGRMRAAVLTQPSVKRIATEVEASLASEGLDASTLVLPDREGAKTLGTVEAVALELNRRGLARGDLIVGVGGGAATDTAGFVAATYLRGIECILVPTTLLGAVDAAVGGKTGVNVGGKNLVGAFAHPSRVLVDVAVLEQLPQGLVREGTAEAVKTGLVGDPGLVDLYRRHGSAAPLAEVVERAIAVKARIVSEDFREAGVRAVLNYGHTIGHGIESATGISHGEAVAIGMVAAGVVGERTVGFDGADDQEALIASLGLPTRAPAVDRSRVEALMALDKKRDEGGIRFVVLEAIGKPAVVHPDDATVRAALAAVGIA